MRQSIATKYHGPGSVRGSRVSATASGGERITLGWDDALGADENHIVAAATLIQKMKWRGRWVPGATPTGCVFVHVDDDAFTI